MSDRLELNDKAFNIEAIDDSYYRVYKSNRANKLYTEIREAIIDDKTKLRDITLAKYSIKDGILYYKD